MLVDASEGVVDQDLTVADVARKAGCATLVVLSKWDETTIDLQETQGPPPPPASAAAPGDRRVGQDGSRPGAAARPRRGVVREVRGPDPDAGAEPRARRAAGGQAGPPSERRRRLRLRYGTQTERGPPRFRIFVNDPTLVTRDYGYWVENELRRRFELEGVPVSIDFGEERVTQT